MPRRWQPFYSYEPRGGGGDGDDEEPQFSALYYGGTADEDLAKLAVDTKTLWQGYYPSIYGTDTQEAAEHKPAPVASESRLMSRGGVEGKDIYQRITDYFNNQGVRLPQRTIGTREVYRPDVSDNDEIVPWAPAQWMVSMGQWRGT